MSVIAHEFHLKNRPSGLPVIGNFSLGARELDTPGEGQLLVRNLWLSVDPYMRGRMMDIESYVAPYELDQPMGGGTVGIVEQSRNARFKVGAVVSHDAVGATTR